MSTPIRVSVPPPSLPPRAPASLLTIILIVTGGCLVAGAIFGVVIARLSQPHLEISGAEAAHHVEIVLHRDYGLVDATNTSCDAPDPKPRATFTCTSSTGAHPSGKVTVPVTVLNDAGQLSVGAPHGEDE